MNDPNHPALEKRLQQAATNFAYPPTPDLAAAQRGLLQPRAYGTRPRLAWSLAGVVLLLAALLLVPPVRAQVLEFIQIGVVRIFPQREQTPPPAGLPSPLPQSTQPAFPTPEHLASVLELSGETTLEDARAAVDFPIRLPAYPSDLGEPDYVFLQNLGDDVVILVWMKPGEPEQVLLSLHILGPEAYAVSKFQPAIVEETQVNGKWAIWTRGPYLMEMKSDLLDSRRLILGHVLIWTDGGAADVTYRLETAQPLAEAVRIAESLR